MRPLVVLLLVLGSLAALLIALKTLTGGGPRGGGDPGLTVAKPAGGEAEDRTPLVAPTLPEAEDHARPATEDSRQALRPETGPGGPRVQFGAIEGKVLDEQGVPIAEARVSLMNMRPTGMGDDVWVMRGVDPPRPAAKVVTDAKGTFRFDRLDPRKDWTLVVTHDRYVRWDSDSTIPVPEDGVWPETITLKPGQTCSGFVRDAATKQPIVGAQLVLDSPLARGLGRKKSPAKQEITTDAEGHYVFHNTSLSFSQPRVLTVSAPGYATQVHNNFALANIGAAPTRFKNVQGPPQAESRTQDFELEPGKVIAGRVQGPDGRGVSGIEIEALNQTGTVGSGGFAKSGASGEFLLEGLAEGLYTVRVTATNYDANPLQRVEAGDTNVVIELFQQAVVTGKVVDPSGQPLSTFVVKARAANEISKAFGAVMGQKAVKGSPDGTFELGGIPEGAYVVEASAEGYASSFSDTFNATQGLVTSDVVVRMNRGGSLSGRIVDAYGNAAVAGAEVSTVDNNWIEGDLFELFGALEPSAMTKTKVFTDADGRFAIDVMTPGPYQVQIKARGYSPVFVNDVEIVEGRNTELPAQLLSKGAVITGVVYGRDGAIQPGATVQLTPEDPNQLYGNRTTRADATGRFVIENAQPGTYQLSATRPNQGGGNPFEAIGDMRQSQIEVSIEDGGRYEFDLHMGGVRGN